MLIQIQYVKISRSAALDQFIRTKLEKTTDRYAFIQKIEVFLKLETKSPGSERICEIEFGVPGGRLHARASCKYFEEAVKKAIAEISRQLEKKKDSLIAY